MINLRLRLLRSLHCFLAATTSSAYMAGSLWPEPYIGTAAPTAWTAFQRREGVDHGLGRPGLHRECSPTRVCGSLLIGCASLARRVPRAIENRREESPHTRGDRRFALVLAGCLVVPIAAGPAPSGGALLPLFATVDRITAR